MRATPTNVRNTLRDSTPSERFRLGLMIAMVVFTLIVAAVAALSAIRWNDAPFIGTIANINGIVNAAMPNGDSTWPGLEAGLTTGDQLLMIDDLRLTTGSDIAALLEQNNYRVGDEVTVTFERLAPDSNNIPTYGTENCAEWAAGVATCTASLTLIALPLGDFVALFAIPFISGLIVFGLSIAILVMRPRDAVTFPVLVASLSVCIYMLSIFDAGTSYNLTVIWLLSGVSVGMSIITIGLVFPKPIRLVYKQPYIQFAPAIFGGLVALYILATYNLETVENAGATNRLVGLVIFVGMAVVIALLFFLQRPYASNQAERDRANSVFLGFTVAFLPGVMWALGLLVQVISGERFATFAIEVAMAFFIIPVFSLSYAMIYYRQNDTDKRVSQTLTYGLMLLVLIIGYFMLVLGASLITTGTLNTSQTNNPILIIVTIFTVSLLFVPVRTALQRRIDRFYYRTRHDYQAHLEAFSQRLTTPDGPEMMIREFRSMLDEVIQPTNTIIFLINRQSETYIAYGDPQPETDIAFGMDSGVVQLLQNSDTTIYLEPGTPWPPELHVDRVRLGIIRVMVLAGMPGSTVLNGFVTIGPPRSGKNTYNFEELRFIRNLVGRLSVAVERAQVIQSLESSVRELNVLSNVAQAVNFTIEFDDLLELISVQTLRLISAPFFYIILNDQKLNQIYYAFFLEDDERIAAYEDKKWMIGRDLYSEVITRSQPRMVTNYTLEMANNGYDTRFESKETMAWMGVPLLGRASTLGVLALGTSNPNDRFTSDQLKIFSDIGSLAATAIEKARLFNETTTRARQLSVLNEISRQLVAAEGNVEGLLTLITESAVEILNAEAGSLLLTVNEETGELEFNAAVGGTGHELIGQRLPPGHGIVGKVAETRQFSIINDTSVDTDWSGEVVQDESFHTNSILAVPLIAKDRVIGVLEMINKKGGDIYVQEDAELLTTFAGQAAIALENARLLKETDLQLNERIKELEVLEFIDRELNRTQDLRKVAEITIRWAISQSGATSALIGMLDDAQQFIHVIAKHGYSEEDIPEGAEGNKWPINSGIVHRVLRTRQADLQPDVTIDPDYVPSLRGAISQITVPMLTGDEITAIFILETSREPRLNLLDLNFIQRLVEHASIAIANAQLFEEITRANETKSEFVGFAAHELNNPLTPIKGYASTLQGSMAKTMSIEQIQSLATIIKNNADRMQGIIQDLRDVAASDANKLKIDLEPIPFPPIAKDALITLQKQLDEKGQIVVNNIADHLPEIMADRDRVIQVMINFISNAHKYSGEESTITLDAIVKRNYVSRRTGKPIGDVLHIMVNDNGIGMKEEDRARLFNEDYFRSDDDEAQAQKGTGLGMMITKRIIEGHQGEVWVESKYRVGSTFNFVIPLANTEVQKTTFRPMQSTGRHAAVEVKPEGASD